MSDERMNDAELRLAKLEQAEREITGSLDAQYLAICALIVASVILIVVELWRLFT